MLIRYTLTPREHREAQWLAFRPRRPFAVLGIVVVGLFIWALWYSWFRMVNPNLVWIRWVLLVALIYYPLHAFVIAPIRWDRTFRLQKALTREARLDVGEDGMEVEQADAHASVAWADLYKWKEGKSLFLVYFSDRLFHIIPKRGFVSPEEVDEYRDLLLKNVGRESA